MLQENCAHTKQERKPLKNWLGMMYGFKCKCMSPLGNMCMHYGALKKTQIEQLIVLHKLKESYDIFLLLIYK